MTILGDPSDRFDADPAECVYVEPLRKSGPRRCELSDEEAAEVVARRRKVCGIEEQTMSVDYAELNVTDRQRVLRLLSDCDWHPHYELKEIGGVRYGGRIHELKRLGYRIETRPNGKQGCDYRLVSTEPGPPPDKQVKVYLTEQAAEALVARRVTPDAWCAAVEALGSFKANKGKL